MSEERFEMETVRNADTVYAEPSRRAPGKDGDTFLYVAGGSVHLTPAELRTLAYELIERASAGEKIAENASQYA